MHGSRWNEIGQWALCVRVYRCWLKQDFLQKDSDQLRTSFCSQKSEVLCFLDCSSTLLPRKHPLSQYRRLQPNLCPASPARCAGGQRGKRWPQGERRSGTETSQTSSTRAFSPPSSASFLCLSLPSRKQHCGSAHQQTDRGERADQ